MLGVKFIRISDGADLYRYFNRWCADSGYVPYGTCRYALVANGGSVAWENLIGDGSHHGGC